MTAAGDPIPGLAVVDAHCHIDLYPDPAAVLARAEAAAVRTIAVTNAPASFPRMTQLVSSCRFVRAAIGLHPETISASEIDLAPFWEHLPATRYVGEIGLDYVTQDRNVRESQRRVFAAIVERCGEAGDKILTIHSRRAAAPVLQVIGGSFPGRFILHWFSGSVRDLERAVEAGAFFSVNPAMIRSASGNRLVASIPRDRVLTETDGPFVMVRDRPAEPKDTALVVNALARIWSVEPSAASAVIRANLRELLRTS